MSTAPNIRFGLKALAFVACRLPPFAAERLINACFDRARGEELAFTSDFFGFTYRGNLNYTLDQAVFFFGAYTRHELLIIEAACAHLKPRRGEVNLFDVGANVGHHALFASRCADHIFAFEPLPDLRAAIEQKIHDNRVTNIQIFPQALSDAAGEAIFFRPQGTNKGGGSLLLVNDNREDDTVQVETIRGDDLDLPRMDILKIDVEGAEPRVLAGLKQRLSKDRPVVLLELSETARAGFGSEQGLREALYERAHIVEIAPPRFGRGYRLKPFDYETSGELLICPEEERFFP